MSKYLKSFITAFLVVCMTVCLGIFAAACTDKSGDDKNGDDAAFPTHLNVTVMLDETTPAVGVEVQPCTVKDNGSLGTCLAGVKTNEQGVASIELDEELGNNYEIHLTAKTIPEGYAYVDADNNPYGESGMHVDVTKNSSPTITLKAVTKTPAGTSADPLVLTVGADAVNFNVDLVGGFRPGARGDVLNWKDDYHAVLTTSEAGNYKITVTVSLTGDNVEISVAPKDQTVASPDTLSSTNGNDRSLTCALLASQEYSVSLMPDIADYTNLVSSDTTSLSYSIKVEYVGEGPLTSDDDGEYTTEDITSTTGEFKRKASDELYFDPGVKGTYTLTVNNGATIYQVGVADSEGNPIKATSITIVIQFEGDYKCIAIDKDCTITVAFTPAEE